MFQNILKSPGVKSVVSCVSNSFRTLSSKTSIPSKINLQTSFAQITGKCSLSLYKEPFFITPSCWRVFWYSCFKVCFMFHLSPLSYTISSFFVSVFCAIRVLYTLRVHSSRFALCAEPWDPRLAANVNNFSIKLARMEGSFVWHSHETEDEVFLVTNGTMRMQFRDGDVDVYPGELIAVPAGLEHCPMSVTDYCDVVLFEPSSTLNTGDFEDAEYIHPTSKEGKTLRKDDLTKI